MWSEQSTRSASGWKYVLVLLYIHILKLTFLFWLLSFTNFSNFKFDELSIFIVTFMFSGKKTPLYKTNESLIELALKLVGYGIGSRGEFDKYAVERLNYQFRSGCLKNFLNLILSWTDFYSLTFQILPRRSSTERRIERVKFWLARFPVRRLPTWHSRIERAAGRTLSSTTSTLMTLLLGLSFLLSNFKG